MVKQGNYALRKLSKSDLPQILDWRNDPVVRQNMYTDHVITVEEHVRWFEGLAQRKDQVHLVCEYAGQPIGVINFVQIDPQHQRAYWGFYMDPSLPPGRGAAMEFLALEYAFSVLHLRKLCCEVFSFNEGVIKLHKKFGFQQEGLYRYHVIKSGQPEDVVFLALFPEDFLPLKDKLQRVCFRQRKAS